MNDDMPTAVEQAGAFRHADAERMGYFMARFVEMQHIGGLTCHFFRTQALISLYFITATLRFSPDFSPHRFTLQPYTAHSR